MTVEETLRGRGIPARITVAFRALNCGRDPGTPAFTVQENDRAVFVLTAVADTEAGTAKGDLFRPLGGAAARIPLPAEGAQALLDALRQIIAHQDQDDFAAGAEDLNRWLTGVNPWLIDAALAQLARLGLGDRAMAPGLVARTHDASPERRIRALQALGAALSRGRLADPRAEKSPVGADEILEAATEAIVRLARTDPEAQVRRAAVRELGRVNTERAKTILAAVQHDDPAQDVRYEAAAALAGGPTR